MCGIEPRRDINNARVIFMRTTTRLGISDMCSIYRSGYLLGTAYAHAHTHTCLIP